MKETAEHPEGAYYTTSGTASDSGQSEAASTVTSDPVGSHLYLNSVIFSPEKGDQSRGHYQQTVPMKWAHQEPSQQQQRAASWTMPNWGPNFTDYSRTQNAFVKSMHETSSLQPHQASNRAVDKSAVDAYREAAKSRALEWEQQAQVFQETLKPGVLNPQQQSAPHPAGSSVLQPFQLAFGQPKQHLPVYYQTFQGSRSTLPNPPNYPAANAKPSHHLQPLQNSDQIQHQQHPVIQQQVQHHQIIQQQLHHEQQQQKMQQQLQLQQQMQHQQLQQNPHVLDFYSAAQNTQPHAQPVVVHSQESSAPVLPTIQEPMIQDITPEPQQPCDPLAQTQLRRSRRLSKEGGAPSENPFLPAPSDCSGLQGSENGACSVQAAPTGVIQSTQRKRRVSQEVNLELLAQEASERKSPSHDKVNKRVQLLHSMK